MLRGAAREVRVNHDLLSQLDSFGGDGDHGTTMVRAMDCLERAMDRAPAGDIKALLTEVGWAIMGVDGGATGPLLGSLFAGMAEPLDETQSIDVAMLARMFAAALASVRNLTQAKVGDKTMMDALIPAVEALRTAAEQRAAVDAALARAAEAASTGAEATKDMQARFGRAKNIGEKSKGRPDPGAVSVSLLFRGFAQGVNSNG